MYTLFLFAARALGCSPTTAGNELRRGTPPRKSNQRTCSLPILLHRGNGAEWTPQRIIPCVCPQEHYSAKYILSAADALNARHRKKPGTQLRRNCLIYSLIGYTQQIANTPDPVKEPASPCLRHP